MKRTSTIITIIVVLALVGLMVARLVTNKKTVDSKRQVVTEQVAIAVSVGFAEMREPVGELNLVGITSPNKEVTVTAESPGKIVAVNFDVGDFVRAGRVLARVDDVYKRLAFENAKLNHDKYKEDYERFLVLREGDAVSEVQLRDMKMAYEAAKIQLESTKKQWDDTRIVAPFSGTITKKSVEVGAFVNVGTAVAEIADVAQLVANLTVSENDVYRMKVGQGVNVRSSVFPDEVFQGKITNITPRGSAIHTFPVEVTIANSNRQPLKAGTFVSVQIDLDRRGSTLMVPRDAIVSSIKDPTVYLVKGNTAHLTPIVIGGSYGGFVEVVSGLTRGDQVVTGGQINLADGAKVQIINQ